MARKISFPGSLFHGNGLLFWPQIRLVIGTEGIFDEVSHGIKIQVVVFQVMILDL
jgi:hypothetical protein